MAYCPAQEQKPLGHITSAIGEGAAMNPLTSITGAIVTGLILALLITFGIEMGAGAIHFNELGLARWVHILSGIMWIGLLYYFNVVQVPGLAAAAADKGGPGGAGVTKYIAPRALLWFRWAAVVTWLTGAIYLLGGFGSPRIIVWA